MSSPLLFTVCSDPAGCAVVALAAATGASWSAGWVYDHRPEITASWHDGVAQLAAWRAALTPRTAALARAALVVAAWLLAVLLPAHGTHRGAGVAR